MNIILLGAPGAGKGTQAALLAAEFAIPHISTGNLFRQNIQEQTPLGQIAAQYIGRGELVPDDVVLSLVVDRLKEEDCQNGFILDGFPRTILQAEALSRHAPIDYFINIAIDSDLLLERITGRRVCNHCGRSYHIRFLKEDHCGFCGTTLEHRQDDHPETVKSRMLVYAQKTAPLITYYENQGVLLRIDGNQSPEQVFADIKRALTK